VPFSHAHCAAGLFLAESTSTALRLLVSTPVPNGDILAEQSAVRDGTEPAGDGAELARSAVGRLGDGNQPSAQPASKSDQPMAARIAHRIVSAPGLRPCPRSS